MPANHTCYTITGTDEMYETSVEKGWNEICGRVMQEKPQEKPTQTWFVHHKTHMSDQAANSEP